MSDPIVKTIVDKLYGEADAVSDSKVNKSQILAALPKLKPADLEAVSAVCQSLLGGRTGAIGYPATPLAGVAFDALSVAAKLAVPYANVPAATQHQFNARLVGLSDFLDAHFKGWAGKKTTQMAFLRMLFTLLADDIKSRGVKPTIGVMVTHIPRMPEVFDNAFPGYVASGLGGLVLQRFK